MPDSGVNSGGAVVIGIGYITLPVGSTAPVAATNEADIFTFNVDAALDSVERSQIEINNFNVTEDSLRLDLPSAYGATTLAQLNGSQGVAVQTNSFTATTVVNFGNNMSGDVVALVLVGVTDSELVNIDVV